MEGKKLTSRQVQASQTKSKLFDCAHELLKEKAFNDISVRDIAEKAGVSVGAFYLYFPSKLDVFYQTYAIADQFFEREVVPKIASGKAKERIFAFFGVYAEYNSEVSGLRLAKILYNSDNKYFNRNSKTGMLPILSSIIEDGMSNGEIKSSYSHEKLAQYMMIAARGCVYHWCSVDGDFLLKDEMLEIIGLMLEAL
jgi:AcrR family transcriptional regulator